MRASERDLPRAGEHFTEVIPQEQRGFAAIAVGGDHLVEHRAQFGDATVDIPERGKQELDPEGTGSPRATSTIDRVEHDRCQPDFGHLPLDDETPGRVQREANASLALADVGDSEPPNLTVLLEPGGEVERVAGDVLKDVEATA